MTRIPDFDELVGHDLDPGERERLRAAHEALLTAGPPPELPASLEAGPTIGMTMGTRVRRRRRGVLLLAAALVALGLVFTSGYAVGNRSGEAKAVATLALAGTNAAPSALASLRIEPVDAAGNWPMELSATGLPKLPAHAYYEVFLVRDGQIYAPCGTFVTAGAAAGTSVRLNAPYGLHKGDSWLVTEQLPGGPEPGAVVLRPSA